MTADPFQTKNVLLPSAAFAGYTSRFRAINIANQLIPGNVVTTIQFPLEDFDPLGEYDPVTHMFSPSAVGVYFLETHIKIGGLPVGRRIILEICIPPLFGGFGYNDFFTPVANNVLTLYALGLYPLNVGATLAVQLWHDWLGGNLTVFGASAPSTYEGFRIG